MKSFSIRKKEDLTSYLRLLSLRNLPAHYLKPIRIHNHTQPLSKLIYKENKEQNWDSQRANLLQRQL